MRALFWLILICSLLESYLQLEVKKIPLDKLGLQNNYNDIVRDLIKNWDSPIVYLRQLGYLPNDFEDTSRIKPNLDELISRMEGDGQKESLRHEHVDTEKLMKRLHKRHNCCHRQQEQRGQRQALPVGQDKSKLLATKMVQGAQHISDAKVDEIKKELDQQQEQKVEPMNVAMLGRVLAKQQAEMVQPQPQTQPVVANAPVDETITDSMDPSDKYLMELVAKTSPKQEEQAAQVAPAAQGAQQVAQVAVAAAPSLAIAPASAPATSQGFAPATSAVISPAISPAIAPGIAAAKTNPKSLVKAPRVAVHLVDTAAKGTHITMPLEPISFDPIGTVAQDVDDDKSQSIRKGPTPPEVEIDAPKYLKYDLEKKQLKEPSEHEKDAYIRKLVRLYAKFNERQSMDKKIEQIQNQN